MKIYLASNFPLFAIRKQIKEQYNGNDLEVIDPIEQCYSEGLENDHIRVVNHDKDLILKCDILVAYIERASFGTAMEILYAYEHEIPVYVINPTRNFLGDYWVKFHSKNNIFESIEDCFEWIQGQYIGIKNKEKGVVNG